MLTFALVPWLFACGTSTMDDGGGAAHIGVIAEVDMPDVTIWDDDGLGTEVSVSVNLEHMGGPAAETFEVVSASLGLDLEPYADIELAIPTDHPVFPGLDDGESFDFVLRGSLPDTHTDWGLCGDPQQESADELRVTLNLSLRVTPGANDDADDFEFESMAVALHCAHAG